MSRIYFELASISNNSNSKFRGCFVPALPLEKKDRLLCFDLLKSPNFTRVSIIKFCIYSTLAQHVQTLVILFEFFRFADKSCLAIARHSKYFLHDIANAKKQFILMKYCTDFIGIALLILNIVHRICYRNAI